MNAQSTGKSKKRTAICTYICDKNVDVMLLTETWLRSAGDEAKCEDLTPPGYSLISFPRDTLTSNMRGGGIAFIVKESLKKNAVFSRPSCELSCYEAAILTFTLNTNRPTCK